MKSHATIDRWFDERGYGFAVSEDGQSVFVHMNDYVVAYAREADGELTTGKIRPRGILPTAGEKIVFDESKRVGKGPKAAPWTFAASYDQAVAESERMKDANAATYRVMEQFFTSSGPGKPASKVTASIREFLRNHPRHSVPEMDAFPPEEEMNGYQVIRWWERKDGERWVRCNDPRPRPGHEGCVEPRTTAA